MWWNKVEELSRILPTGIKASGIDVHPTAILDESKGPITIGYNTKIGAHAFVQGPLIIGDNCIIGNNTMIRGPSIIGNNVLIGFSAEVKQARLEDNVSLGPLSYVADSILEEGVFLGAMVRTSNFRLDDKCVEVLHNDERTDSGMRKLGCLIGMHTNLGVGCRIYPGREVPPNSLFEMDVHIKKNLPSGHYRIKQDLEKVK